jgi:hypothetical protein
MTAYGVHRLALVLVAIVGLSLTAPRGGAAATCQSTCTQQLAACKQTCPGSGQARRDCRAVCAERSTCTAPGARIRTLAYVVSDCTTDPQGRNSLQQKLLVRRGNCDPVAVMETAASTPVPDPLGRCRAWGASRDGKALIAAGVFHRLAVLPDGSGVVFEVTKQFSVYPSVTPEPPAGDGIFFVRAEGTGRRRLGPASRVPDFLCGVNTPFWPMGPVPVSPDGRSIALTDLGPDTAGHEAPQIFLLDVRSGRRTQVTRQSQLSTRDCTHLRDPVLEYISFINKRTLVFYDGSPLEGTTEAYRVETDGSGVPEEIPAPSVLPGARVVSQFAVTSNRPGLVLVTFTDRPVPPFGFSVNELFLIDGKNLVQLTNFGRWDTGFGQSALARGRVFFVASANLHGENPDELCQLFSINERGGGLRQLTQLPSDGRVAALGCLHPAGTEVACGIEVPVMNSIAPDPVTGSVVFGSSCDPVGGNPFGDQLFTMRQDGTGLRQLTAARGREMLPDGTLQVELVGPWASPVH